jgi:predicted DsbA family dithiol-disulfide isomerase
MARGHRAGSHGPPAALQAHLPPVTLYSANVCPFCPIIKRRLADLQKHSQFELEDVDVTFRPDVIRSKGPRSVPVPEANGQLLVGHATSEQIAEFLRTAAGVAAR